MRNDTAAEQTAVTAPPVVDTAQAKADVRNVPGSWKAWTHQISYFEDRYRFISWDYRGLFDSDTPRS